MSLPINIEALMTQRIIECERIEFKAGWNPQSVLHSICAFANDFNNLGGGYIVVGVDEEDGQALMPPAGIAAARVDGVQKELLNICHFISPNYFPVVDVATVQGKRVLVIWCPPGDMRPYKAPKNLAEKAKHNKLYYIRRMSSTVVASDVDQQRLFELAAKVPFDNRINHHASIDDFDLTHIATFLKAVDSTLYGELPQLSLVDVCRNMGIARGADDELKPLNVGLLMFSDDPTQFFRGARIELVEYQDSIGDQFRETIFSGPIWQQLKDVLRYLRHSLLKEQVVKVVGQAEAQRFYNYPFEVLEEAIANAVYHKGYDRQNPIEISIRHDCIEILSFPGPVPPVSNASLKQERVIARDYRNSRLGDFLKELRLTEGRSTGIPKIRRFLQQNGSPSPKFETDSDNGYFLVTLYPHPDAKSLMPNIIEEVDRDQAGTKPGLSRDQAETKLGLSRGQAGTKLGPSWDQAGTKLDAGFEFGETEQQLLGGMSGEMSLLALMNLVARTNKSKFRGQILKPLIAAGFIELTIPDKPTSPKQRYRLTPYYQKEVR